MISRLTAGRAWKIKRRQPGLDQFILAVISFAKPLQNSRFGAFVGGIKIGRNVCVLSFKKAVALTVTLDNERTEILYL